MARLIVEDGGQRRRFQLNPGKMTVGSSESATLTLTSGGVADVHVELEIKDDDVVLRPRPGVEPPRAGTREITGPVRLKPGVAVQVGEARLSLEGDGGAATGTPAAGRAKGGAGARSGARTGARSGGGAARTGGARRSGGREAGGAAGEGGSRPQRVQRQRPTVKQGLPTWAILLIFVLVGLVAWIGLKNVMGETTQGGFDAPTSQARLEEALRGGQGAVMLTEMEKVREHWSELSTDWRQIFEEYEAQAEEIVAEGRLAEYNMQGTQFLDGAILPFQQKYLRSPQRPESRFFLKRAQHFLDTWPDHPRIGEVRNMVNRYKPVAELGTPDEFPDVAFEAKKLTEAFPRDYETALDLLAKFRETASPADQQAVDGLVATHEEERAEYFQDRYEQAKYYWDRGEQSKAMGTLIVLVNQIGDREMADRAARAMVAFHGGVDPKTGITQTIDGTLRGYKTQNPEGFAKLRRNSIVRAFMDEHGIE